ncbi:MAG: response regulator [Pseudomonadota bacterium]|nr:response regulator [Pseudomonadota bacterium]
MALDQKLFRDRKILRRVDVNLAVQSRLFGVANLLLFLFVATVGGYYGSHPRIATAAGLLILALSALQFTLVIRFDTAYGAGPGRWRTGFILSQIAAALGMGLFSAAVILADKLGMSSFLVTLYMVGLCALNNVEWSPYHQRNTLRLGCGLMPPLLAYVLVGDLRGLTIAVALLIMLVMLWRQSRIIMHRYWETAQVTRELQRKAGDLAQAANAANHASQFKTEFLSHITHEIRTPMNNVLGMLALLDDTELSPQQRELQTLAAQSGASLLSLIDDIVDFSRISSGQVQLQENVFNIKRCIDQSLELLGPRAHDRGMELNCRYAPDLPVRVKGDSARLAQLIENLVSNAIKYSQGDDIILAVTSQKVSESRLELRISVKDNGKGIAPELQNHLFEAFASAHQHSPQAHSGTGLGLAISKGLVECMNGKIGFQSNERGTEFWFTVQLRGTTQQAEKGSLYKELLHLRALVVGARGGVMEALVAKLDSLDMMIESVREPAQAADLVPEAAAAQRPYDLMFVNLSLQQPMALEWLVDLQRDATISVQPRLVLLSSLAQRADAMRGGLEQQLTAEWLSKPVTFEKLYQALLRCYGLQPAEPAERGDAAATPQTRHRILLVEDNVVNQMVAKGMLDKLGYPVTSVVNGKEALGLLQQQNFDLILMDCVMPVMDGYEATRAWREQEESTERSRIPIVAMTASVVEGEQQRCLAAGMDDYLAKPVNLDELGAKLRRWLGASESAQGADVTDRRRARGIT